METNEVIMWDDPNAARQVRIIDGENEITGWVSRLNHFYGNDESTARYDGCTHKKCECGNITEKRYTICQTCRDLKHKERYLSLPIKEWDGETMLCIYGGDTYFHDEDDIVCYCEDNDVNPKDLQLVICEPNYYSEINFDWWNDEAPEDWEPPKELISLVDDLNKYCASNIISWSAGRFRTSVKIELESVSGENINR